MTKRADRYEVCDSDGLRRELVGAWSPEKHLYLRRYVDIMREAAKKFPKAGTTYIDLFCGPGRARVRESGDIVDGSAVVAATEALKAKPFSQVFVGDLDEENVRACEQRLLARNVSGVCALVGPAIETAKQVVSRVHQYGLNVAFLDPYSFGQLSFSLIKTLAQVQRMDLLIHFSLMDFNRNARLMAERGELDKVIPGWQDQVQLNVRDDLFRRGLFQHWTKLLEDLGYIVRNNHQKVTGNRNQPLYLLVLASRAKIASKFWSAATKVQTQGDLFR